jgi:hypothetical protein
MDVVPYGSGAEEADVGELVAVEKARPVDEDDEVVCTGTPYPEDGFP